MAAAPAKPASSKHSVHPSEVKKHSPRHKALQYLSLSHSTSCITYHEMRSATVNGGFARPEHSLSSVDSCFLGLACVSASFAFYKYGAMIRAHCVWTVKSEAGLKSMRARAVAREVVVTENTLKRRPRQLTYNFRRRFIPVGVVTESVDSALGRL
ncbi:hypothetical protein SS1G_02516 [Sclerotinia sclerotiorum 1980 UF-70]|uniref:Uncharacterized protein n=1 Tax=Sclerotinia sclerotiorum (strain ATCC 18683 / 1980 / Ss-1) TaxID=665079 RepID=A7EB30_SCLS1|nr:hypothetical protein SS1G_02516 [Sclerotinia sclerotiorum 1980 UF-70]EDN99658.1 hypothetical protein SS1G_02516 [Sclerotinia sclerotiorum 1980 UF-70]